MIIHGDCLGKLKEIDECSIDSLVTDPPYGLSNIPQVSFNKCMVEWSTGDDKYTPKSKGFMGKSWDGFVPPPALWKEVIRVLKPGSYGLVFASSRTQDIMGLSLRLAGFEIRDCVLWLYGNGFPKSRNHLKPAYEPALLIRKPLEGTVAKNTLQYGTGAINIEGCRIQTGETYVQAPIRTNKVYGKEVRKGGKIYDKGRFPSNVLIDEEVGDILNNRRRFFYCAKASTKERIAGLSEYHVHHPTIKPIEIMRYLCRLVTPPEGIVLDPFLGSGTTAIAALKEGLNLIGIERESEYIDVAKARINYWYGHEHIMTPQNKQDQYKKYEQMNLFSEQY